MREKFGVFIYVCILLWGDCLGSFVVEKHTLKVTSPSSIQGAYDSSIGSFGIPRHGGTLVGTVVYLEPNKRGCKPFDEHDVHFKLWHGALPTVLLVDRGDCFFASKARHAQQAGAAAVLIADDINEPLITMHTPEDEHGRAEYVKDITIPSVFISKSLGNSIKEALSNQDIVEIKLDWMEPLLHPNERVEYEFWTNSDYECRPTCDSQLEFLKNFKGAAQILEQKGYTRFTPHYMTWSCPQPFVSSKQCNSQCINHGRYCAPDLWHDPNTGYNGKDVMVQNLRQACLFKVANERGKPWLWWDYVTDYAIRCTLKEKYTKECADEVIRSLGIDLDSIDNCIGDTEADVENPVLEAELDAKSGNGVRRDVTMLPTLLINDRQYRGKLDKGAVLKAICAGFRDTIEQAICLSEVSQDIQTDRCLENNGGCWEDKIANISACRDTFRGRVCECPVVNGVKYSGDGYTHCKSESISLARKELGVQAHNQGKIIAWPIILGVAVVGVAVYANYKYTILVRSLPQNIENASHG
ncbi:hypothetical protein V6N11_046373 [Hibiscus sabdariffa]|uniref:PA domain-containing protein n=2 Tax=Hibiscus sabdariffa TaxID=183260 RepID=A0ABR2BVE8_9ROSI